MNQTKDIVVGLGEIGKPIMQILSKKILVIGYDSNKKLMDKKQFEKLSNFQTRFLHVCIPYTDQFISHLVALNNEFKPQGIVIHSTVQPGLTHSIQSKILIPVIYSATRGVHKRMLYDLKRYTKFFAIEPQAPRLHWATFSFTGTMKACGIKTKKMTNPLTLELAKIICDTSYYGWLITYAQLSNIIALKNKINYDEMWSFANEIQKFLGNRPKMHPGLIGGHCVLPNLDLVNYETLNIIKEINSDYANILRKKKGKETKFEI